MAWRAPVPQLLLLLLLFPGSWALLRAHEIQKVVGQTLSLKCRYQPMSRSYEKKGWCKMKTRLWCIRLVTSSQPRTLAQTARFSIWDDPAAGFFTVTMTDLREEDSGHYCCRTYHTSSNSVSESIKFYLVVSPVSASRQATWVPHDLVSSQTQSCVSSTGGAREAPRAPSASTAPSQPQNSTLRSGPEAHGDLVPALCGLLIAKSLLLSALLVWWWDVQWKTLIELRSLDTSKATCHIQQVTDLLWTSVSSLMNTL
ncbi:PREDICTED: natural cytotoxicity triggering receptor 2-like, partial [Galeopterus variegatus]|uniref:Natural cytotoxicity triggering receptor 2-like n=1 Tax=Galeopterus variegatus TaxID=482537 RepID=A0ABM0SJ22_GALVR